MTFKEKFKGYFRDQAWQAIKERMEKDGYTGDDYSKGYEMVDGFLDELWKAFGRTMEKIHETL